MMHAESLEPVLIGVSLPVRERTKVVLISYSYGLKEAKVNSVLIKPRVRSSFASFDQFYFLLLVGLPSLGDV